MKSQISRWCVNNDKFDLRPEHVKVSLVGWYILSWVSCVHVFESTSQWILFVYNCSLAGFV